MTESIQNNHVDAVAFCRELVSIPSLLGEEYEAADWAAAKMQRLGFSDIHCDRYGSITGIWQGDLPGPTLLFDSHLDIAPVVEPERWQHKPFGGEMEDGRIWGRGSADTKASLAAMLAALSGLPRKGLSGRIVLAASVQEEVMTGAAVTHILKRFDPDVFVTGEPTSLKLATAQKGRVTLELHARGRSAHTSSPDAGVNAVYAMIEAVHRLRNMPMHHDPELGREILELTEMISIPYPNPGQVPQGCIVRLIGRVLPEETQSGILRRVRAALRDIPAIDEVSVARLSSRSFTGASLVMDDFLPGWRNPPGDAWGNKIIEALASEGLPAERFGAGCGTNASAAGALGIPAFIYGPGNLAQAHTVDEWVSVEDIHRAVRGFRAIAKACLSG